MTPTEPIFVDSVYLIALNAVNDNWRAAAQSAADSLHPRQRLVTTHGVLSETIAHFARAATSVRNSLARQFRQLGEDPLYLVLAHHPALMDEAFYLYSGEFADSSLSLQDCVSIVIMREYGITSILTADQEFTRARFTPLLRRYLD